MFAFDLFHTYVICFGILIWKCERPPNWSHSNKCVRILFFVLRSILPKFFFVKISILSFHLYIFIDKIHTVVRINRLVWVACLYFIRDFYQMLKIQLSFSIYLLKFVFGLDRNLDQHKSNGEYAAKTNNKLKEQT